MDDGRPAGNLFASGEIMAGSILGKGYLAGFGMAIGTVFGRIAGQEAAKRAEINLPRWRGNGSPSPAMLEARRAMEVCNACRYCEGFCAVFPAMELRRDFADGDLNYLANLCHSCRGCYYACQYAPPHEFGINVPRVLAEVRAESYAQYAWPDPLARLYQRNGLVMALAMAGGVGLVLVLAMALQRHDVLFAPQSLEPGRASTTSSPGGDGGRRLRHLPVLDAGDGRGLRPVLARHRRPRGGAGAAAPAAPGVSRRGDPALPRRRRPRLQRPGRQLLQRAALVPPPDGLWLPAVLRLHVDGNGLRPFPALAGALPVLEPARAARHGRRLRPGRRDGRAVLAEARGRPRAAGGEAARAPMPGCCCCCC